MEEIFSQMLNHSRFIFPNGKKKKKNIFPNGKKKIRTAVRFN
jgi:hypothetical protein